jgi:hypothetical protein
LNLYFFSPDIAHELEEISVNSIQDAN